MRITNQKVSEILQVATSNIVEVIGDYVSLKKKGNTWWGLSPFKTEKTPSFAVSPSKGIYKCFSTGKGGGVVNFLMEIDNLSFQEALLQLAKKFNISVDFNTSQYQPEITQRKESLLILNQFASEFFQQQFQKSEIAKAYLEKRGFFTEVQQKFQIGFAPLGKDILTQAALNRQFKEEFLLETGLTLKNDKNEFVDKFRNRIMFPIHNLQGKVIGFGGRIHEKNDQIAKYVNSPDSIVYNKSQALYGLFQAKETIRKSEECILVEGYLDVIALFQFGFHNAVASCGTSLTEEQARLIKRFASTVIILYDGDEAGIKATQRALQILIAQDLNVKVLTLPNSEDPDSFLQKNGKESLENLLKNQTIDGIDYQFRQLREKFDLQKPQEKAEIIKELAETISKIKDELKRSIYIQYVAQKVDIQESIVSIAVNKHISQNFTQEIKREERKSIQPIFDPNVEKEKELLRVFFRCGDKSISIEEETFLVREVLLEKFKETEFQSELTEKIRQKILSSELETEQLIQVFINNEDAKISQLVSGMLLNREVLSPNWFQQYGIYTPDLDEDPLESLESAIYHFEIEKIEQLIKKNLEAIASQTNPDKQLQLLIRQKKLCILRDELYQKTGIVIPPGKISF